MDKDAYGCSLNNNGGLARLLSSPRRGNFQGIRRQRLPSGKPETRKLSLFVVYVWWSKKAHKLCTRINMVQISHIHCLYSLVMGRTIEIGFVRTRKMA